MRLIDADKLHYHRVWIASIKDGEYNGMKSDVVVFAHEIYKNKKARVDAVPVVRCKDCKWLVKSEGMCYLLSNHYEPPVYVEDDHYCSMGIAKGRC